MLLVALDCPFLISISVLTLNHLRAEVGLKTIINSSFGDINNRGLD
jgi:hypothetical protein